MRNISENEKMSDEIKMEKHNSKNYEAKHCWTATNPGQVATPTAEQMSANEKAVGALLVSINDDVLDIIEGCETSKEVWDTLQDTINLTYGTACLL